MPLADAANAQCHPSLPRLQPTLVRMQHGTGIAQCRPFYRVGGGERGTEQHCARGAQFQGLVEVRADNRRVPRDERGKVGVLAGELLEKRLGSRFHRGLVQGENSSDYRSGARSGDRRLLAG